jgi:23S rRNA (adenine2030-N6)-methyltransferase
MGHYDHREHAGNAGDLWKHFLLLEVADCLLTPDSSLVYAESHVGRPKYALKPSGDWESGIGRIWPALPLLKDFPYFDILAEANPSEPSSPLQIECYPGSALLLAKLAKRKKADLKMEIWDIDPAVEAAWNEFLDHGRPDHGRPGHGRPDHGCPGHGRFDRSSISFHLGDGFSGCMSLLRRAPPGLLLIDPPFTSPGERRAAEELFCMASESGWTVLCWHMKEAMRPSDHPTEFPLLFSQIGLDYAKAAGCSIRAASPHTALLSHLSRRARAFLHISASSK